MQTPAPPLPNVRFDVLLRYDDPNAPAPIIDVWRPTDRPCGLTLYEIQSSCADVLTVIIPRAILDSPTPTTFPITIGAPLAEDDPSAWWPGKM